MRLPAFPPGHRPVRWCDARAGAARPPDGRNHVLWYEQSRRHPQLEGRENCKWRHCRCGRLQGSCPDNKPASARYCAALA
eukprot:scaffold11822_cov120-Isochrysis_galbana.AAC.3